MIMKMIDAKALLEEKKMDAATILTSLSIVRIRRLASEMALPLARATWRGRKAEIIAAFVAGMEQGEEHGTYIPRAVRILAAQGAYESIITIGARMVGTNTRLGDGFFDFEDSPKDAQDAFFMEALEKKLADSETDVPAAIALIEKVAKELVTCTEERKAHDWVEKSATVDYTAENAAWHAALSEMRRVIETVQEGGDFVRTIALKRAVGKIDAAPIDGGYIARAKLWRGKGKTRIYVNVYDADGKPQLATPYLEDGAVYWQYGEPRKRPVWAESVIAAMMAV